MALQNPRLSQLTLSKYLYINFLFKEKFVRKKNIYTKMRWRKKSEICILQNNPHPPFSNSFQELRTNINLYELKYLLLGCLDFEINYYRKQRQYNLYIVRVQSKRE